ncbi:hypothetical protein N7532_001434, partial [Penicillium argentinense]
MTLDRDFTLIDLDGIDNKEIRRHVLPRTENGYQRALAFFDKFVELHPCSKSPPNIQNSKGFLKWYAVNTRGRIEEKPTVEALQSLRRDFQAGMQKMRGFSFSPEHSTTLGEYIIGSLRPFLSTAEMDKNGFSPNDLMILMTQLWCQDSHEYRGDPPDRTRVQLSAAILLYCFTSARTGEVHESTTRRGLARQANEKCSDETLEARTLAACYKNFTLTIEMVDQQPMLVLTYQREFIKGYWRKTGWEIPIHAFYETYREDTSLFLNLLTFFLPMAVADNALENYSSVSAILDAAEAYTKGTTQNKVLEVIKFRNEVLDIPIFRQYTELRITKSTGRSRGTDAFGKSLVGLGHRSGYTRNITVRACRRWALMQADKNHSETARMKFGGQTKRETFGRSYAHPVSEVDGPANFLGIATREEHIQNRRGMGIHHRFDLCQYVPAKAQIEFQNREDVKSLSAEMYSLSECLQATTESHARHNIQKAQKSVYSKIQRLYKDAVDLIQKSQNKEGLSHNNIAKKSLFHYRRRVMPYRDILAELLPRKCSLRDCHGREALQALEHLCLEDTTVAYRNSLKPKNGKCICGVLMKDYMSHRQWLHLYRCHKAYYSCHNKLQFTEMCFECDIWFTDAGEWETHCSQHLEKPTTLLRCDPLIFRNAPIKAGFCPFCLGNKDLSSSRRMFQFIISPPAWHSHIQGHLTELNSFKCTHPACLLDFDDKELLIFHLMDTHCWHPRK